MEQAEPFEQFLHRDAYRRYTKVCPVCAKPLQNDRIDEHGEESGAHGEEHMADCPAHGTWHWDDEGFWGEVT